jgi:hypothetical protein
MEFLTKKEGLKRLKICEKCEHFKNVPVIQYCDKCKCVLKIKVYMKGVKCPIEKW